VAASFATAGIILAAIYILWMYQRTMTGPVRPEVADMPDLRPRELWAVGPLIAVLIFFGVYPKPLLDVINPAVHDTLSQVHVTDPQPQHPSTASASTASFRFGNGLVLVSAGGAQIQKGSTP
jgi:NADH-quinone oxidoreductase subunit M